jgi:hypothetical protein
MTFLSRRKRPTTRRAAPGKLARKITSAVILWLTVLSGAQAQRYITPDPPGDAITPTFTPVAPRRAAPASSVEPPLARPHSRIVPASYHQPQPKPKAPRFDPGDGREGIVLNVQTELPGVQRLFRRDSETDFYERIIQERKREFSGTQAIFPDTPVLTKQPFRPRNFPRLVELVEPCYVAHGRLLFEQPNFERIGYSFGVLQPAICVGVYCYDLALFPYHVCSDLRGLGENSVGKCLPGDPAPLLVPRERLSVTGLAAQAGAAAIWGFLFP